MHDSFVCMTYEYVAYNFSSYLDLQAIARPDSKIACNLYNFTLTIT